MAIIYVVLLGETVVLCWILYKYKYYKYDK